MAPFTSIVSTFLGALGICGALPAQNQALTLTTGIDGGVRYAFDPRMVPASGITVEAWITYDDATVPTGAALYWPTIARQNVTPNQESWNLRVSAGNTGQRALQFIVRASNNALYNATWNFAPGALLAFTHVAGTFDGQTIRIVVGGVQVASSTLPLVSGVQNNGGELRIGNGDPIAPGNESWNGSIDEVRIWPMARTPAEIAATNAHALLGMPGSLLVFPFDGGYDSLGGAVAGIPFGTVGFTAGAPALLPLLAQSLGIGQATTSCTNVPELLIGSPALLGNGAFTLWCVRGPTPSQSPAAALFAATTGATGLPPVLGVSLAFDPTTIVASAVQAPPTNVLGNANFVLPIPNQAALLGAGWVFQYFFLDAACGPQGLTASNGLQFAIQ